MVWCGVGPAVCQKCCCIKGRGCSRPNGIKSIRPTRTLWPPPYIIHNSIQMYTFDLQMVTYICIHSKEDTWNVDCTVYTLPHPTRWYKVDLEIVQKWEEKTLLWCQIALVVFSTRVAQCYINRGERQTRNRMGLCFVEKRLQEEKAKKGFIISF